MAKLP